VFLSFGAIPRFFGAILRPQGAIASSEMKNERASVSFQPVRARD